MDRRILYIDPINATPPYNFCLLSLLEKAGIRFQFYTTRFAWDDELPKLKNTSEFFFKRANFISRSLGLKQKYRRILRSIEYPENLMKLRRTILHAPERIIHLNWSVLPGIDVHFIRSLQNHGRKIVLTVHNPLPHDSDRKYFRKYKKLYNSADALITLTEFVKRELCTYMMIDEHKVTVIPHVNFQPLVQALATSEPGSKKSETSDQKVILFFGGISPYKGLDILIEAFAKVITEYPDCKLRICGNPYENFSKYQLLIRRLGIKKKNIELDLRFVSMRESVYIIMNADLVVLPYKSSSQSGVIPYANTLGVPVVTTCVGGIPEMIVEGVNGYCIEPNDPDSLANKIVEILQDPQKLNELKQGAHRTSQKIFSNQIIISRLERIYLDFWATA